MKKTTIIVFLLGISFIGFSQRNGNIRYGLFAGINVSEIYVTVPGAGSAWSESKIGTNFGILTEIPITKYFSIQPELSYSSLGWKESQTVYTDSLSIDNPGYNLNYLCLPLLVKFKIPPTIKNGSGLAIYLGPQFGYLANANLKGSNISGSADIKDGFKRSDLSGVGGAEYFIRQGVGISVRYQFGFENIFSNETNQAFNEMFGSDVIVKNNALTITVGYRF